MRIEDDKIMISVTELDHVLDILDEDKNMPPSELFFKELIGEIKLNGLYVRNLDKVSNVNIELKEWNREAIRKLF